MSSGGILSALSALGLGPSSPAPGATDTTPATNTTDADASFTESVASAAGPNANPRLAVIVASLVRHLHAFTREVDLTSGEWMEGVDFLNRAGVLSTVRNEMQLIGDVLGLESLVDQMDSARAAASATAQSTSLSPASPPPLPATSSAVLGPFYKLSPPLRAPGAPIASPATMAAHADAATRVTGRVLDATTNAPIAGALVDIWHADPDGTYEGQGNAASARFEPGELRGVYASDADGSYDILCLRPGPYPIPDDGPVGELLHALDRSLWRPAHIHFRVSAPGFCALTTQLFDKDGKHLEADTVFAVKDDLRVEFAPVEGVEGARYAVQYDFRLTPEKVQ